MSNTLVIQIEVTFDRRQTNKQKEEVQDFITGAVQERLEEPVHTPWKGSRLTTAASMNIEGVSLTSKLQTSELSI